MVGLPLGGGDEGGKDDDAAVGGEHAVFKGVGFVDGGEGRFGVDGGGEVGAPALGQPQDGVGGFGVRCTELDGADGEVFLVDIGQANGA